LGGGGLQHGSEEDGKRNKNINLWISALKCRYELTRVAEIYSVDGTLNNLFGWPDGQNLLKRK
jgi:hypothetical protein